VYFDEHVLENTRHRVSLAETETRASINRAGARFDPATSLRTREDLRDVSA